MEGKRTFVYVCGSLLFILITLIFSFATRHQNLSVEVKKKEKKIALIKLIDDYGEPLSCSPQTGNNIK